MNHAKRRQDLLSKLQDNSLVVLFAGEEVTSNADEVYDFNVNHSFYYFTGIDQRNSILVLKKFGDRISEELYLLKADPLQAKWIGEYLDFDEAKATANI